MADGPQPVSSFASDFVSAPPAGPSAKRDDVSIVGVMLLSAFSVALAVIGMLMLGLVVVGAWWLASHIPVPDFVWRVLLHLGLISAV